MESMSGGAPIEVGHRTAIIRYWQRHLPFGPVLRRLGRFGMASTTFRGDADGCAASEPHASIPPTVELVDITAHAKAVSQCAALRRYGNGLRVTRRFGISRAASEESAPRRFSAVRSYPCA